MRPTARSDRQPRFGQEKNITTYNLARMNMLLHGVKDLEFEIYHGDTLTNDWDILRETNPAKKPYFDAVAANPPFSYRWDPNEALGEVTAVVLFGAPAECLDRHPPIARKADRVGQVPAVHPEPLLRAIGAVGPQDLRQPGRGVLARGSRIPRARSYRERARSPARTGSSPSSRRAGTRRLLRNEARKEAPADPWIEALSHLLEALRGVPPGDIVEVTLGNQWHTSLYCRAGEFDIR